MTTLLILAILIALLLTGMPIFAGLGLTAIVITVASEGSISSIADTVFLRTGMFIIFINLHLLLFLLTSHSIPTIKPWLRCNRLHCRLKVQS